MQIYINAWVCLYLGLYINITVTVNTDARLCSRTTMILCITVISQCNSVHRNGLTLTEVSQHAMWHEHIMWLHVILLALFADLCFIMFSV